MKLEIRGLTEEDTSLVYNAWLKSYRGLPYGRTMTNSVFYAGHKKVVDRILQTSQVMLAVDAEDPSQILSFVCWNNDAIHYIYTKYKFRKLGIASELLKQIGGVDQFNTTTHLPRNWGESLRKYGLDYNPYLIWESE